MSSPSKHPRTILFVEDDLIQAEILRRHLRQFDPELIVHEANTGRRALQLLEQVRPDIVILDLVLPDVEELTLLSHIRDSGQNPTIIMVSANASTQHAVDAMRLGAHDFLTKPVEPKRLNALLKAGFERARMLAEVRSGGTSVSLLGDAIWLEGQSLAARQLVRSIQAAARGRAPVLVTGEEGSPGRHIAMALHEQSRESPEPFFAVEPEDLITPTGDLDLAALGSFLHSASEGTIFFSKLHVYTKLLQEQLFHALLSGTRRLGMRLIGHAVQSARSEDAGLDPRIEAFFGVQRIRIPALRTRLEDLKQLAEALMRAASGARGFTFEGFSDDAVEILQAHDWPGNAEELYNVVEEIADHHAPTLVTAQHLPSHLVQMARRSRSGSRTTVPKLKDEELLTPAVKPLWQVEKEAVEEAVALCKGDVTRAARLLEVSPADIYRKMKSWEAHSASIGR